MKMIFPLLLVAALASACSTAPNITDVTGKEWKLIEVYVDGRDTLFRRTGLPVGLAEEFFTLKIDLQNISGRGAPNLYSAPYTLGDRQAISVRPARATLMASFYENEYLKEHDFFTYVQNANEWKLVNKNLEFSSRTQDNKGVRLVFSL